MTPEGRVKTKVKKILADLGAWHFSPQAGIYGRSGIPDIIGCYHGHFFAIECKANGNTTTPLQEQAICAITGAGGLALVVDESNIDRLKRTIVLLGRVD